MFLKSSSFLFDWIIQSVTRDMAYSLYEPIRRHCHKKAPKFGIVIQYVKTDKKTLHLV